MTKKEEKLLKKLCSETKTLCECFMAGGIIYDPMTLEEAKKITKQRVDHCYLDVPEWMKIEIKNYIDGLIEVK